MAVNISVSSMGGWRCVKQTFVLRQFVIECNWLITLEDTKYPMLHYINRYFCLYCPSCGLTKIPSVCVHEIFSPAQIYKTLESLFICCLDCGGHILQFVMVMDEI